MILKGRVAICNYQAKRMAIVKKEDKTKPVKKDKKVKPSAKPADDDDDIMDTFGEFNLLEIGVPPNAWPPRNGCYGGKHGYTLKSPRGAVPWFNPNIFTERHSSSFKGLKQDHTPKKIKTYYSHFHKIQTDWILPQKW